MANPLIKILRGLRARTSQLCAVVRSRASHLPPQVRGPLAAITNRANASRNDSNRDRFEDDGQYFDHLVATAVTKANEASR